MRTLAKFDGLRVPAYALSYLVNGDASGLSEADAKAVDSWLAEFHTIRDAKHKGGTVQFCHGDGEPYFTKAPAFGLACDVVECTVLILGNPVALDLDDEIAHAIGAEIAKVLGLRKRKNETDSEPRFQLEGGSKNEAGLARTIREIILRHYNR